MEFVVSYHLQDKRVNYQINTDLILEALVDADIGPISVIDLHGKCKVRSKKINFIELDKGQLNVPDDCVIFAAFYQDIDAFLDICGSSKNRKIVSVWHGIPLRRINLLDAIECNQPVFQKARLKRQFLYHLVSSDFFNRVTVASWDAKPENVITIGNIRSLADQRDILWPHGSNQKIAVFCPSNAAGEVFNSVSGRLGLSTSDQELNMLLRKNNIVLYHKGHGQATTLDIARWSNIKSLPQQVLDFYSVELNNLFHSIDLMISDCSSLMVDFLDFGKPVIFSSPTKQYLSRHTFNVDESLLHGHCPVTACDLVTQMLAKLNSESLDKDSAVLKQSLGSFESEHVEVRLLDAVNKISLSA